MKLLEERIRRDGKIKGGDVLKVDSFLNHQMDVELFQEIGKEFKVMIDREEEDFYVGRTEFDSPEVDPEILVSKEKLLIPGMFYNVRIDDAQAFDLYGSVL